MKKRVKFSVAIGFAVFAGLIAYSFLFGKLFPYSPLIIGFSENELENTVVCVQKGSPYRNFAAIDSLIPKVEEFHDLKFIKKPRIFIFKDKTSYYRRSLSKARFCAFYNGDIVISPWALEEAEKNDISLDIYLRHELSHSLLHQHAGILGASRYPAWLLEGIAVYSTNQMGTSWYPSKTEVYDYIKKGNFMPPEYFRTRKEERIKLDVEYRIAFIYSEFACIVDYLVERHGREKLIAYMKELLHNSDHERVFRAIYGIDLSKSIQDFREAVLTN